MRSRIGLVLSLILVVGLLLGGLSACSTGNHHGNGNGSYDPNQDWRPRGNHG
jgi:hypothetical protein